MYFVFDQEEIVNVNMIKKPNFEKINSDRTNYFQKSDTRYIDSAINHYKIKNILKRWYMEFLKENNLNHVDINGFSIYAKTKFKKQRKFIRNKQLQSINNDVFEEVLKSFCYFLEHDKYVHESILSKI